MFDGNMSMGVPVAGTGRWWVLTVVVAAQFMFVVDAFIVNVALPSITADLHAEAGAMEAVIAVYQAAYAALVITGGRLGDIYGRKPVFIVGVLAFTAASAWCGLSASATELVLARLAQGATAALMVPQVLATLHVLFPGEGRNRAFAVFGITAFAAVLQVPAAVLLVSALAVFGFGQGLVMAPLAGLVLANVAPAQAGSASGMLNTVQQASGAIGVTTIGSVYAVDGAWAGLAVLGLSVVMTATLLRGFDQARS